MGKSLIDGQKRKLLAAVTAMIVLTVTTTANAAWICDPQVAYLEEYGFLDPYGPSRGDIRRLHRDQWRATYYGGYYDPVVKALRKHCPGSANRGRGSSYYW
jgi:hypothetical protein